MRKYDVIESALINGKDFNVGNVYGTCSGGNWKIINYTTCIYQSGTFNATFYSNTTSRLQNIIKRILPIEKNVNGIDKGTSDLRGAESND